MKTCQICSSIIKNCIVRKPGKRIFIKLEFFLLVLQFSNLSINFAFSALLFVLPSGFYTRHISLASNISVEIAVLEFLSAAVSVPPLHSGVNFFRLQKKKNNDSYIFFTSSSSYSNSSHYFHGVPVLIT